MKDPGTLRHRITVDEYYRMAEVGLLAPDARVELIDGEIIDMAPMGVRHGGTQTQLAVLLAEAMGSRALVREEKPIRLSEWSEPQPDVSVVKRRKDFYKTAHPTPEDTFLAVEVSETTLRRDMKLKVPLYARHGIPELWIVDLKGQQIHFFRSPDNGAYKEATVDKTPGVVSIAMLPEVAVDLSAVFS